MRRDPNYLARKGYKQIDGQFVQPAGERNAFDEFPEGSINHRVATQLRAFSTIRQTYAAAPPTRKWTAGAKKRNR